MKDYKLTLFEEYGTIIARKECKCMKKSFTLVAFGCLLIQFLYLALLAGYILLGEIIGNIPPNLEDFLSIIGIILVLILPFVCFATDISSFVFQIIALINKESKAWNILMMIITIILTILAVSTTYRLLLNMFYG
jgi:hypothetical protein